MPHSNSCIRNLALLALAFIASGVFPGTILSSGGATAPSRLKTRNVILITTDVLRGQEAFRGAEEALLTVTNSGVKGTNELQELRRRFVRETPHENTRALVPLVWGGI